MTALLFLTIFVPDLAQTIGVAAFAAFDAIFDSLWRDDPARAAAIGWKAWQMLLLIIVMPVAVTAVLGELFRLGGALGHAVVSGLLAALVPLAMTASTRAPSGAEGRVLACLFFAGAAGGLIYFLIGGRKPRAIPFLPPHTEILPPR
ncbi:MAG: hypothetical protein ACRCUX_01615, partial [Beijerinckiaceae bacterium]